MFNLTGSEIMFLLIIGLVVLGPEKLPDAIRRVGRLYAELKRMSSGVQTDLRKVMDEPLKEMMNTTNSMKSHLMVQNNSSPHRLWSYFSYAHSALTFYDW